MNVFAEIMVSEYLPQCPLAGFPKLGKKKKNGENCKNIHEHIRWSTKTCDKDEYLDNFIVFEHITDENNDMTSSL